MGCVTGGKLLSCLLLLSTCSWGCSITQDLTLTLGDVFPFGTGEGDLELPTGNDVSETVVLDTPVLYFGELRDSIAVRCYKQYW